MRRASLLQIHDEIAARIRECKLGKSGKPVYGIGIPGIDPADDRRHYWLSGYQQACEDILHILDGDDYCRILTARISGTYA